MNKPDLGGAAAKLERAKEHIRALQTEWDKFVLEHPARIISKRERNSGDYVVRIYEVPPLPLRFSVITGEIVHALRSSLDHLICQLAIANGNRPLETHQFPVFEQPSPRFKEYVRGISGSAAAIVESLQPYEIRRRKKVVGSMTTGLRLLHEHPAENFIELGFISFHRAKFSTEESGPVCCNLLQNKTAQVFTRAASFRTLLTCRVGRSCF